MSLLFLFFFLLVPSFCIAMRVRSVRKRRRMLRVFRSRVAFLEKYAGVLSAAKSEPLPKIQKEAMRHLVYHIGKLQDLLDREE